MEQDLTKGSVLGQLFKIALPTMAGFSFQMLYDLVDLYWLGEISSEAIAGVTVFTSIFWLIEVVNEIIGVSSISLISQSFGKKDYRRTEKAIEQTMGFKIIAALFAAVFLFIFIKPLMKIFVADKVLELGLKYGYIRIFFLPFMFSSFTVNTSLRSLGDAKTPMKIMLIASVMNVILDPLLMLGNIEFRLFGNLFSINGANLGVQGAAYATIIAQTFAVIYGAVALFSGKGDVKPNLMKIFKIEKEYASKLIRIGLPNGFEVFARNMSNNVVLKYVAVYGTAALSAFGIGSRIFGFAFMPLIGLNMGGSSIVGQSLGAEDIPRAKKAAYLAAVISSAIMFLFTLVVFLWGGQLISLFDTNPEVVGYGRDFLVYGSFGLIFIGVAFGLSAVFSGSGYNFPFLIGGLVSKWLLQIPFLIIVVSVFKGGILLVWISFLVSDITEFILSLLFFRQGKWKHYRA